SFREIAVAGDALQLAPGLAAWMSIRANVAISEPAVIDAIVIRTEMPSSVDGTPASSSEGEHRRGGAWRLGWCISTFLTCFAQRLVDQPGEGCGGAGMVGPPDMDEEADQDQSDQEELVQ